MYFNNIYNPKLVENDRRIKRLVLNSLNSMQYKFSTIIYMYKNNKTTFFKNVHYRKIRNVQMKR